MFELVLHFQNVNRNLLAATSTGGGGGGGGGLAGMHDASHRASVITEFTVLAC